MQLTSRLQDALNRHVGAELSSAHLYLSMSAYCQAANLPGFAHWLRVQHQEETGHALKFIDFIDDRDGRVLLGAIESPPTEFGSPLDVMEQTLEHERKVTSLINRLYELAVEESDYPTQVLLQWFISEQVEEEKNAAEVVEQLKIVGDDGAGLLMIDARLGQRSSGETE